ncbi:hypothetical protein NDU88_004912 [Pleurodeles waltl]|uniref:Uncharacterized protein n=1 Tax=Pleurodeles waltl TaxID=8319 RepID=A0AAV7PHD1_PLEWA|nr:hypothetical protein NDU88_004912 [Pleurodeles waltl]
MGLTPWTSTRILIGRRIEVVREDGTRERRKRRYRRTARSTNKVRRTERSTKRTTYQPGRATRRVCGQRSVKEQRSAMRRVCG